MGNLFNCSVVEIIHYVILLCLWFCIYSSFHLIWEMMNLNSVVYV